MPPDPAPAVRPIRRLLVANRGELVARIARTCRALGIRCLALVTADQRAAWWAQQADEQVALDGSYLDVHAVLSAALACGADALHPGYGFLAERPDVAEAVVAAGLTWVGPPASAIRAVGDKAAARRLAQRVGVPVLPGYDGDDQGDRTLRREAARIGFPVLVKPSAGGGGKGMHVARAADELPDVLAQARRETQAAFGDDRLILERFLDAPRHVEVQVLVDAGGSGVHLGERDCSLQRRHQKVIEEAPAPAVGPLLRERLSAAALRIAGAAGYVGAGTVEFLVIDSTPAPRDAGEAAGTAGGAEGTAGGASSATGDPGFFFLEMNARLQVEHPVTEQVAGRDLVADQLRIAAGEPLEFSQSDVQLDGHAFEARLYAEDPWHGFLPSGGNVVAVRWPDSPGTRVDAGVAVGDAIGTRYDPLLAKIIVHGHHRNEALARLQLALEATRLHGATTNLAFLRWLARLPEVAAGDARVDTIGRSWPGLSGAGTPRVPDWAWRLAAQALAPDPLAGFRLNAARRVRVRQAGEERALELDEPSSGPADTVGTVRWSGRANESVDPAGAAGRSSPSNESGPSDAEAAASPTGSPGDAGLVAVSIDPEPTAWVDIDGWSVPFRLAPAPDPDAAMRRAGARGDASAALTAPMPGTVLSVGVRPGDTVEARQTLVVIEAMKMEHAVPAPGAGRVVRVSVEPGQTVQRGEVLVELE